MLICNCGSNVCKEDGYSPAKFNEECYEDFPNEKIPCEWSIDLEELPGGSTPSQYALPEGCTDLQDLIEYRDMNFAEGNIMKAIYRKGVCSHSDRLRDMRKIKWFSEREIARLEKCSST